MNTDLYKNKDIKKLLLLFTEGLVYQSYLEGSINKDLNINTLDIVFKNAHDKYLIKGCPILFIETYLDSIKEEAESLYNKQKYELAIGLYGIWLEHWINDLIKTKCIIKKLSLKEAEDIIKNTNNYSKYTWLLSLLDLPPISKKYLIIINQLIEKRNTFIHYKYKGVEEDNLYKCNEEYKSLCLKMPSLIKYLKYYFSKNIISLKSIKKITKQHPYIKQLLIDKN